MILGFDIDGSITDIETEEKMNLATFCFKRKIPFNEDMWLKPHLGLSEKDYQDYMNLYFPYMVNHNPPRKYTSEIFHRLKSDGHTIIIITARDEFRDREDEPYKGSMMKKDTLDWFKRNDIPYDKIIFSSTTDHKNKGIVCRENHIDLMLEDEKTNIDDVVYYGIPCVIMRNSRNKNLNIQNTCFVDNMLEYFMIIQSRKF